MSTPEPVPPWLRIAGDHAPAHELIARAAPALARLGVESSLPPTPPLFDYAQVDPTLAISPEPAEPPPAATGYAGLTPAQRGDYQRWANTPERNAPLAFRQLYAANLECWLLEQHVQGDAQVATRLNMHLQTLLESPNWRADDRLPRVMLLAAWLQQDAHASRTLSESGVLSAALLQCALGMQALLPNALPLSARQAALLAQAWHLDMHDVEPQLLELRLNYLAQQLGADPLQHALAAEGKAEGKAEGAAKLDATAQATAAQAEVIEAPSILAGRFVQPWRSNHRDLRLLLPQPDLRPLLEPLLASLFTQLDLGSAPAVSTRSTPAPAPAAPAPAPRRGNGRDKARTAQAHKQEWLLVVEFGESRSQYYSFALELAQREKSYQPLLDERREIIHRIHYRKGELRRFWRLWDYIQTWSNSRVYVNGNELEKWQVWPWSHYLR